MAKNNKAKKNSAELEKEAAEASSVDSQQSLSHTTGSSVCAKNISRTPNGKKVVLWTRLELLCNIHVWHNTSIFFFQEKIISEIFLLSGFCAIQNRIEGPFKSLI